MTDTKEETARPASTPQDETSRSCTRLTACEKANCPSCRAPITGNHHVRDLSQELETTPPPKRLIKPPAPPDHFISTYTDEFKQALLANNTEDIHTVLMFYDLQITTCPDFLNFDRTELMNLVLTARKLHKGQDNSQPAPAPATHHLLHPPDLQTVSMKMSRAELTKWNGLSYDFYPWILCKYQDVQAI